MAIGSGLDLPATLRAHHRGRAERWSTPGTARSGCSNAERTGLAEFITVGIDDAGRRAIGDLPKGHGILGLLIADPGRCGSPISTSTRTASGSRPTTRR